LGEILSDRKGLEKLGHLPRPFELHEDELFQKKARLRQPARIPAGFSANLLAQIIGLRSAQWGERITQ